MEELSTSKLDFVKVVFNVSLVVTLVLLKHVAILILDTLEPRAHVAELLEKVRLHFIVLRLLCQTADDALLYVELTGLWHVTLVDFALSTL